MIDRVLGGRYRIVRHLAKGGMAEVYLAHDQLLDRPVAVKVLVPDLAQDATFVERFRREAQAAAGLNHHNVVSVYDFGQDGGAYFIVMEYVDGPTLRDIVRQSAPLAPAKAIEIGGEIAAGLAAAHHQRLWHRDVKPANVLMTRTGNVKVADFGIARAAHSAREGLTMPGAVVGTATYLSPEQALGEDLDQRSDIYSLGMVLYEMLAGRAPFTGDTPVAVAYKQVNEVPPPPSHYNPDVPPALDAIVLRALAKDPAERQQSAEALRAELLDVRFGTVEPEPTMAAAAPAVAAAASPKGSLGDATATAIATSGPPTAMMPPPTGVEPGPPAAPPPPRGPDPAVYRRRRLTAALLVLGAAVAVIALAAALTGGDGEGNAPVTVPGVVGFDVNDAVTAINDAGLTPRIEVDDDLDGEQDLVARQDPVGGSTARRGDTVKLFLPAGSTDTSFTTPPTTEPPTTEPAPTTTPAPATTQAPATTVPPATVPPATVPPTTTPPTTLPPTTAPPETTPEPDAGP